MVKRITIQQLLTDFKTLPIIDVRSPGEFERGHIIGAHNIPLFSNEERAAVGTVYKQRNKQEAIDLGYQYVTPKLTQFLTESKQVASQGPVVVHCWRGGMRSEAFANHLHQNGFNNVFVLERGYKAYRQHIISFFDNAFDLLVLGGYTGSGKTEILMKLGAMGEQVVDLEALAHHKGSAFGGIGQAAQPTSEHFENKLYTEMQAFELSRRIWVEDESMNIGRVIIPQNLFKQIRNSKLLFINIPRIERSKFLVKTYGLQNIEKLRESIIRITKRLGHLKTQQALDALQLGDLEQVAEITLEYYDKAYHKGMSLRDNQQVIRKDLETVSDEINAPLILNFILGKAK